MPSVRLTIIVRLDQAASLNRLSDFREERRTAIGTDVSVLLSAADGPAATKLFSDLAGDGSQTGGAAPIVGRTGNEEEMEDPHRTAYHEAELLTG